MADVQNSTSLLRRTKPLGPVVMPDRPVMLLYSVEMESSSSYPVENVRPLGDRAIVAAYVLIIVAVVQCAMYSVLPVLAHTNK